MFNFRLQRVLDLRTTQQQNVASRLADARRQAEAAEEARAALAEVRNQGWSGIAAAHGMTPTAGQLQNLSLVAGHLDQHLDAAESAVHDAEQNVAKVLDEYTAAVRERRVLDRLRERHFDTWKAEQAHSDRSQMDDIALTQYNRAGGASRPEGD